MRARVRKRPGLLIQEGINQPEEPVAASIAAACFLACPSTMFCTFFALFRSWP